MPLLGGGREEWTGEEYALKCGAAVQKYSTLYWKTGVPLSRQHATHSDPSGKNLASPHLKNTAVICVVVLRTKMCNANYKRKIRNIKFGFVS